MKRAFEMKMVPPVAIEIKFGGRVMSGSGKLIPRLYSHFEVVGRNKNKKTDPFEKIAEVHEILGEKPTKVPIRFLSDDVEESFSVFRAFFSKKGSLACGAAYGSSKAHRRFKSIDGEVQAVEPYEVDCNAECPFWQKGSCDLTSTLYCQLGKGIENGALCAVRVKGTNAQKYIKSSMDYISRRTGGILAGLDFNLCLHFEPRDSADGKTFAVPIITVEFADSLSMLDAAVLNELKKRKALYEMKHGETNKSLEDLMYSGFLRPSIDRDAVFAAFDDEFELVEDYSGEPVVAIGGNEESGELKEMFDSAGYNPIKREMITDRFGGDIEKIKAYISEDLEKHDSIPSLTAREELMHVGPEEPEVKKVVQDLSEKPRPSEKLKAPVVKGKMFIPEPMIVAENPKPAKENNNDDFSDFFDIED